MAQQTRTLTAAKLAYISYQNPSTHYQISPSTWYEIVNATYPKFKMLFGLTAWPSSLKHNKLTGIQFFAQLKAGYSSIISIACNDDDFDQNTVTWYTAPEENGHSAAGRDLHDSVTGDFYIPETLAGRTDEALAAHYALSAGSLCFTSNSFGYEMKSVLSNSAAIRATVTYDDSIKVNSKIAYRSGPTAGSRLASIATEFSWDYVRENDNAYCAIESWAQKSAVFYWKTSNDTDYHAVSVSGNTKQVTIPANTFPTGATIQWYVKGTNEYNTTTQTSVYSFATAATSVAIDAYPAGNGVDTRDVLRFLWHVNNSSQQSAIFYWRKSGTTDWNQIPISGSVCELNVPGYTFPTGAAIQWYIRVTDASGVGCSTGYLNFMAASAAVEPVGFPSGSNIDTRSPITFTWSIAGTLGEYVQKSAKFYWKKSTSGTWNVISTNSRAKSVTVPADTFPTSSTIQWYVDATDASGTVTSFSQKTFTTVSTKITVQAYPSGNSVDFGSPITFTWIFKNAAGTDYPQSSASLFWRTSTADPWAEIPASGSAQRLTVPAYTFPSNSTVSWYLQGTDSGGTTSVTSTASFKTVAPQITPQNSPTSGYADPRNAITFAWFFSTGGNNYPQESADFYWRVQGEETWNHVAAAGSTQSVTIPADTFPLISNIEWYLTGTDIGGTYSETEVFTFSTTASTASAVCMNPVGKAVDGTKPVTLSWIVQNDDGSKATRTIVRWKLPTESQSQWHELIDTTDGSTEYEVAAGTFPAGPIEWAVIAYNRDSVAGPASQASFVCIAAPDPPTGLTATAVPLTEISWQSTGQEAYEISIDGEVVTEGFGSAVYSYRVLEPLPDGAHTISVRIQGSYGLWSEAAETQIFVENVPKGVLTLIGDFGVDADLYWEFSDENAQETVAVYRDGVWIGTANGETNFRDRYVLGTHEYRLEYWFSDGYYTRSDTVTGTMSCSTLMIAELSDGPWLELRLSENQTRTQTFQRRRVYALTHITAAKYPVLETSPFEDLTGNFDCAFRDKGEAAAFKHLFGRTVILKTRAGEVLMGGLVETDEVTTRFYTAYTFSIQQIHVEDFVHHDAID